MATKAKPQNHQNHGVGQLVFARLSVSSLNQGQGPPFAIQDQSKTNPGPQRHHGKYPSTTVESPSLVLAARNFHSLRLFSSHIFGTTGAASILAFRHPLGGSLNCYPYLFRILWVVQYCLPIALKFMRVELFRSSSLKGTPSPKHDDYLVIWKFRNCLYLCHDLRML